MAGYKGIWYEWKDSIAKDSPDNRNCTHISGSRSHFGVFVHAEGGLSQNFMDTFCRQGRPYGSLCSLRILLLLGDAANPRLRKTTKSRIQGSFNPAHHQLVRPIDHLHLGGRFALRLGGFSSQGLEERVSGSTLRPTSWGWSSGWRWSCCGSGLVGSYFTAPWLYD